MLYQLGTLTLLSLLLSSSVRAADCNFATWQDTIDQFSAADKEHPTEPGGVVFLGSSSIRMWDLKKSFPDKQYLNRGFGGSEICHSTHFITELVAKHKPRLVVFYAGDNDVAGGKSASQVHEDFQAFAQKFSEELSEARLVYIAIKPSIARWHLADKMREANTRIATDCEQNEKFAFVDVWPVMLGEDGKPRKDIFLEDGLHMNDKGYGLWVDLLKRHLD